MVLDACNFAQQYSKIIAYLVVELNYRNALIFHYAAVNV